MNINFSSYEFKSEYYKILKTKFSIAVSFKGANLNV